MSEIDFKARLELWLCDDCTILHETGDVSGIAYSYNTERAAQARVDEIEAGLTDLGKQGYFANDYTEDTQRECRTCGHIHAESDFEFVEETDDEDEQWLCPKCSSSDTDRRESGYDEFSWRACDCCGSNLGGSRTCYALFPYTQKEESCESQ